MANCALKNGWMKSRRLSPTVANRSIGVMPYRETRPKVSASAGRDDALDGGASAAPAAPDASAASDAPGAAPLLWHRMPSARLIDRKTIDSTWHGEGR